LIQFQGGEEGVQHYLQKEKELREKERQGEAD